MDRWCYLRRDCSRTALLASIALLSTQAIADCKLRSPAELPVTLIGLHPLITVQVDGRDVPVVLDTGAMFNLLSYDAATKLHLPLISQRGRVVIAGVGGSSRTLSALAVAVLGLGAVRVADAEFIISGAAIGSAAGFIGNSTLKEFDVDYDLAGRRVKLLRASGCDDVALPDWARSQPHSVADNEGDGGPPTILGYVNGVEMRVEFDTGASTSILDIRAAARAGVTPKSAGAVPGGDVYGVGHSNMKTWVVPISSIKIGEEEIHITHLRIGDLSLPRVNLLLGTDFFLSHQVYFSNSQQKIYFTHNGGSVSNPNLQSAGGTAATQK
jgi:predicted aspartyl protease